MNARRLTPELMDSVGHEPEVLRESLRQVAQVNRRLGGVRAFHHALRPFATPSAGRRGPAGHLPLRILDVGTGNGDLPLHLLEWSASRGATWKLVGLDRHPEITPIAAERAASAGERMAVVRGDALKLPFDDHAFDIVLCTLVLHHFEDDAAERIVREMARVARRAVLVNDLERCRPAAIGARILAATLWRGNRLTRHDGPRSVEAAFTRDELLRIGKEAGLHSVTVRRFFPFRLLLQGRPGSAAR